MTSSASFGPRRVRPGEFPRFGQVWSWLPNGPKYLALGTVRVAETQGYRLNLVGLQLLATPNRIDNTMRWSLPAHVGVGTVLRDWYCHDEGDMGHPGSHTGNGSPDCPRERHHHHDEKCPT